MIANIFTAIRALRKGASVENPTGLKWAGVAVAAGLIVLNVAQSYGYLTGIAETDWIELIMAALVIYSQIATTTKIGILSEPKRLRVDEVTANVGYPDDGLIYTSDQLTQHIMKGREVPLTDAELRAMLHGVDDGYPPNSTTGYVHGPQPEAVDAMLGAFFDLDERAQEAIRATQPLDPVALSDRIRRGDFAAPERVLPPKPRVSFQSKPYGDYRGQFTPE